MHTSSRIRTACQGARALASAVLIAAVTPASAASKVAQPAFEACLRDLLPQAQAAGLTPDRFTTLMAGLSPDSEVLDKLDRSVKLPAEVIEQAFLEANPDWSPDTVTITCEQGYIQEARICFTRDLTPRPCAPDTARDCTMQGALFEPIR